MTTTTTAIESLARDIAVQAHQGQTDKAGEPYIGHVERVVARLDDPLDRAVGWLHDVVEDTGVDFDDLWRLLDADTDLTARGVWSDVERLTHLRGQPRADYYTRVRTSARAVRVKLADIADNEDEARLAKLPESAQVRLREKYRKAREALEAA